MSIKSKINTMSKLGLPSNTLLRNQHGKIRESSQTAGSITSHEQGSKQQTETSEEHGDLANRGGLQRKHNPHKISCGKAPSLCLANGLGGRSCQSYEFFILHVEGYESGNSLRRSPFDPVETRRAHNTERHRETPKAYNTERHRETPKA